MCGIIGVFNEINHKEKAKRGLSKLKYRGKDSFNIHTEEKFTIGHVLHSIVGRVEQPLIQEKRLFVSNCEIYNWKELDERYDLDSKNDAEMLFKLICKQGFSKKTLELLDGVYAIAYIDGDKVGIARDVIGVKPLFYSNEQGFYFASEKKALILLGAKDVKELDPRQMLFYDITTKNLELKERPFFEIIPEHKENKEKIAKTVSKLLRDAVIKRIPERKFGLLFSGGIDSTYIAYILKKEGYNFTCYTTAYGDKEIKESEDLIMARKISKEYGLKLKEVILKREDMIEQANLIGEIIESYDTVKIEVGLTFFEACKVAKKDGCKVIFSGLGSEEIFAGYNRHKLSDNINKECLKGLKELYQRDLYRDDVITMFNGLELRLPYLDKNLVEYSLRIPSIHKIDKDMTKIILRESAKIDGLLDFVYMRKKKAAQYGSNISKAIKKISKEKGFVYKKEYLSKLSKDK